MGRRQDGVIAVTDSSNLENSTRLRADPWSERWSEGVTSLEVRRPMRLHGGPPIAPHEENRDGP